MTTLLETELLHALSPLKDLMKRGNQNKQKKFSDKFLSLRLNVTDKMKTITRLALGT